MVGLRGRCRSTVGRLDGHWHVFGRSVRCARKRRGCQCTIDGGATASSSCAARVWASSYEQHRIDHTSARGVFVPVRNEKGGLESCRAATNCPIFSSKGPDGLSPSKRVFCRLGNTSVILPQRAVAGRPRYLAQIPWVGRHSSPW